jgi:diguanylate cyclase (GGDEF)-like protein
MVILGLRTVKVMVLSFSLVDAFQGGKKGAFDYETFWRRSLTCAVTSRLIGKLTIPNQAEEAFVGGLLCDLGLIAAWRTEAEAYGEVMKAWTDREQTLVEIENSMLGVTHTELGGEMLRSWNLPESLCDAVSMHHNTNFEGLSGDSLSLAQVVAAAAEIAGLFCHEVPSGDLDSVKDRCRELTRIEEGDLETVLEALHQHVKDTADLLSLQVGDVVDYSQIQMEAATHLAQLSMQAEVERAESAKREEAARIEASRLNKEKQAIIEVASTDSLTQIANRASFDQRLSEEFERAQNGDLPIGLIMLDVDHFKHFNDTYGHQAGDEVLRCVAACLKESALGKGFVARYGGEEFSIILSNATRDDLCDLAESVRKGVEEMRVEHGGNTLSVTASFGGAYVQPKRVKSSCQALIERADMALYMAKRKGRNRVEMAK